MIVRPATAAAISLLALAVISRADTYTWVGADGTFSNPAAWLDAIAPAASGSPFDHLVFPTPTNPVNAYTATLDTTTWTLNSLRLGTTTTPSPASITLTGLPQSTLLFDGPNPTILLDPLGWHTINIPIISTSSLKISGPHLTLNAPLSFTGSNPQLTLETTDITYASSAPPAGLSQTLITGTPDAGSGLCWYMTTSPASTLSFGSGPITLEGPACFSLHNPPRDPLDQTPLPTVEFTNPIIVNGYCSQIGAGGFASVTFSGPIQLGGYLLVHADGPITLSGPITLDQSVTHSLFLTAADEAIFNLSGNILDDPVPTHTARNPLYLNSLVYHMTISGTANTYSTGTVISNGTVTVAPDSSLGTGDVLVGEPNQPWYSAALLLQGNHAYSPTAHITVAGTLSAIGPAGAIPQSSQAPTLLPYSTLILGDGTTNNSDRYPDSLPLALHDSTLQLQGFANTAEIVGPISFSGLSNIILQNPTTGTHSTTLHAPSLARIDHAILLITPTAGTLGATSDSTLQFTLDTPPASTNGVLPPYIQTVDANQYPSFTTYTAQGIATPAYTAMPTTGTGTEIVEVFHPFPPPPQYSSISGRPSPLFIALYIALYGYNPFPDLPPESTPPPPPPLPPTTGPLTLAGNTDIYALRTNADILNPSSGPATLTLRSGGLITYTFLSVLDTSTLHIEPDVDFGPGEAIINTAANTPWPDHMPTELSGKVTIRGGITKLGTGALLLTNPNNDITGPITVYQGALTLSSIPNPQGNEPITLYHWAWLTSLSSQTLSRPLCIMPDAGPNIYANLVIPEGKSLTLAGPITGFGALDIAGPGTLILSSSMSWQSSGYSITMDAPTLLPHVAISLPTNVCFGSGLSGSGTIADFNTLFIEGVITPGTAPGEIATLRFDSPNLSRFGWFETVALDLAPGGLSDQLLFSGPLLLEPTLDDEYPATLALNPLAPLDVQTYTLISASSITGTFSQVTGLPEGYALQYTPTSILLIPDTASPDSIPEPATLATLLLTTPLLLRRRKPMRIG